MLRIKEAEDFGLGFNCMTRLYMDRYDEEILTDMIKLCEEYLKWFSRRTITCSLRDLIREYPFSWKEEPVPTQQAERYEALIKDLIRQAIGREKQAARYQKVREIVNRVADDMGVTNSRWGKEKCFDRDSFYQWVMENELTNEVTIKKVNEDEILPLKKKYVPMFYKVCNYMINYSYGRHTYMPSTCRSFVKANIELMSDEILTDIVDCLKVRNADIPKKESAFDKIDSDNWIYMQEDLEAELLTRQMFYTAKAKGGCKQELKKLLNELLDLESVHTQKDCLHIYHQLMGLKRYLVSVAKEVNVKNLLKQVEQAEKLIGEKRVDFFEQEEGHLYEKIGEGIYQRKRISSVNYVKTIT